MQKKETKANNKPPETGAGIDSRFKAGIASLILFPTNKATIPKVIERSGDIRRPKLTTPSQSNTPDPQEKHLFTKKLQARTIRLQPADQMHKIRSRHVLLKARLWVHKIDAPKTINRENLSSKKQ